MAALREPIYQALFDLVRLDPGVASIFVTFGRLLPHQAAVGSIQCPALYTFQLPESRAYKGQGIPPIRIARAQFVAYFSDAPDVSSVPASAINAAADALDNAIHPQPGFVQTLGGLVKHTYIEPDIKPFEGLLQDRSILVATVAMLIP